MKGKTMKRIIGWLGALVLAASMSVASAATIRYYGPSSHSAEVATAMNNLATTLGGSTATSFSGTDDVTWTSVLASANIVFLGQSASTGSLSATTRTNIRNWVNAGGVLLVLRDGANLTLLNDVLSASMVFNGSVACCDNVPIPRTPEAAASTYASAPATLPRLNDHGAIVASSIPTGALNAYALGTDSYLMSAGFGAGSVSFLSWDWCCGDSPADRAAWDSALLSAATFSGFAPQGPREVPTLSEWGVFVLGTLLAAGAIVTLRRRQF
jgi:hypothetical protein